MGDYFDDDDLINEYMEQDFEPPSEYDEEFLEDELGHGAAADSNKQQQPEPMDEDPPRQEHVSQDIPSGQDTMTVPTSVTIKPKTEVYSFERYA